MLAIQSSDAISDKCVPNILPCRIHHNGPTKVIKRYWKPSKEQDGTKTAIFRGRRLRGRVVNLPDRYQGLILKTTERTLPQTTSSRVPTYHEIDDDDDSDQGADQEDSIEPVKVLERVSTFDQLIVWGHDQVPPSDDAFVRNIDEWINFAEAIHGTNKNSTSPDDSPDDTKSIKI